MFDTHYIYALSNVSLPGLLKIGWTSKSPEIRAKELSTTALPTPFSVEYAIAVDNGPEMEKLIHARLAGSRWTKNREFFQVTVEEAMEIMKEFAESDYGEILYDRAIDLIDQDGNALEAIDLLERSFNGGYLPAAGIALKYIFFSNNEQGINKEESLKFLPQLAKMGSKESHFYYCLLFIDKGENRTAKSQINKFITLCPSGDDVAHGLESALSYCRKKMESKTLWQINRTHEVRDHILDLYVENIELDYCKNNLSRVIHYCIESSKETREKLSIKLLPLFSTNENPDSSYLENSISMTRMLLDTEAKYLLDFYSGEFFRSLDYIDSKPSKDGLTALREKIYGIEIEYDDNNDFLVFYNLKAYLKRHREVFNAAWNTDFPLFPDEINLNTRAIRLLVDKIDEEFDPSQANIPTYIEYRRDEIDNYKYLDSFFSQRKKALSRIRKTHNNNRKGQRRVELPPVDPEATQKLIKAVADTGLDYVAKGIGILFGKK